MFQRYFTVSWGCGGGLAAPTEIVFLALPEPRFWQSQKREFFGGLAPSGTLWVTSRDCKAETAGFETCLRQESYGRTSSVTIGRVKKKVVPLPTTLSTQIRPPCNSTSARVIASPSPVPPIRRVLVLSTR